MIGGAYGWIQYGWLYIDLLWVKENHRHQGLGVKLVNAIETAARNKGINRYYLTTASFQALDFYLKLNYHVTEEMEMYTDDGVSFIRHALQKIEN